MEDTPLDQTWFYLDAQRRSQGPFPVSYLQELNKAGYFHANTLFWRQGQTDWLKLEEIPRLFKALNQTLLSTSVSTTAAAAVSAAAVAAPFVNRQDDGEDPMESFMKEIKTLDDEEKSPPPEERKFIDDDGTAYEWSSQQRKFLPVEDDALGGDIPKQTITYNPEDMVYDPDELKANQPKYQPPQVPHDDNDENDTDEKIMQALENGDFEYTNNDVDADEENRKRSAREAALEAAKERAKKAKANREAQRGWFELKKNTSVYVTGLPDDATIPEVAETFSKCGIIKEDPETRQPRIKLYRDPASGALKGDALVTYLKEPSVQLAINVLDGAPFRYGMNSMTVTAAQFQQKGDKYIEKDAAALKKKKKKALEAQERRALGWKGFDDIVKPSEVTVIVKNAFQPVELVATLSAKAELEADILSEASKAGRVEKLKIFESNPEGIVSIRFATKEAAESCIHLMDGRWFGGRQLEVSKYDGVTNYNVKVQETEEEQLARLEAFGAELEDKTS